MIKLCIFGSRNLHPSIGEIDAILGPFAINQWREPRKTGIKMWLPDSLICGMAGGADTAGRKWALYHNITVDSFYAEWGKHGKEAGHIRNEIMANQCTHAIGWWDGSSGGTANMVAHLVHLRKPCLLIKKAFDEGMDNAAYSVYDSETIKVHKTHPSSGVKPNPDDAADRLLADLGRPGKHRP